MLLSKSGEYALRALLHLVQHAEEAPIRGAEIADALDVPANYLSKLLHQLARGGVLHSVRGPQGGFSLAFEADTLTLADALEPIEAHHIERRCLLGRPACDDADPCAAHDQWQDLAEHIERFLNGTTVASLSAPIPRSRSQAARRRGRKAGAARREER